MASPRINWITANSDREMVFIKSVLLAVQKGHGKQVYLGQEPTDVGWEIARTTFTENTLAQISPYHMKRVFGRLRSEYLIFLAMKGSGRFGWDDDTGTPIGSDFDWEVYLAHKHKERKYRKKNMRWFRLFEPLMSQEPIIGNYKLTPEDEPPSNNTPSTPDPYNDGSMTDCELIENLSTSATGAEIEANNMSTTRPHGPELPVKSQFLVKNTATNTYEPRIELTATNSAAISLFQEQYSPRFDAEYAALGPKVLQNGHLAKQFCNMKAGIARDVWILVKINLYRSSSHL